MEQVQRQRRRNRLIFVTAIVLIAIVVVAVVVFYPRSTNAVPLPSYLDICTSASLYHAHPSLTININGSGYTIPGGLGILGSCARPIHTHTTDGILHVETSEDRTYTLHDFFLIWGNWANDAQLSMFSSTQIFGGHVVGSHVLNMTVNGAPNTQFENYQIPRNSQTGQDPCSGPNGQTPPGGCQSIAIVITYT